MPQNNGSSILQPSAGGGLQVKCGVSAASNNLTAVKSGGGACRFYGAHMESIAAASAAYLKFYNGLPTMGTTPCVDQIAVPAASASAGNGHELTSANGVAYPNGLYYAVTGGISLTDNTAVAAANFNFTIYFE